MNAIERYRKLVQESSATAQRLETLHFEHLACRKGCFDCCTNLTLFPVEFYAILEQARGGEALSFDDEASCGFLKDGLCSIYNARPMICRTHGLPISFLNMDADEPEMSVSFCPKNFIAADEMSFGAENTFDVDELNIQLYEANLQFVEEHPELSLEPSDRIPLKNLIGELKE